MSPHPDDLTGMKDDMTAFIEGLGMRRFSGYVECEEVPSVLWDSEQNPDGWKDFVELAKSTGAVFLTMHTWALSREELDRLSQLLADSDFRSDEDLEESRWLKATSAKPVSCSSDGLTRDASSSSKRAPNGTSIISACANWRMMAADS